MHTTEDANYQVKHRALRHQCAEAGYDLVLHFNMYSI
jgi:hypothetical protein